MCNASKEMLQIGKIIIFPEMYLIVDSIVFASLFITSVEFYDNVAQ